MSLTSANTATTVRQIEPKTKQMYVYSMSIVNLTSSTGFPHLRWRLTVNIYLSISDSLPAVHTAFNFFRMFIDSLQTKYFDCVASKFTILTRFHFITGLLKQIASDKTAAIPCEANRHFQLHIGCFYSNIIHTNEKAWVKESRGITIMYPRVVTTMVATDFSFRRVKDEKSSDQGRTGYPVSDKE